MAQRLLRMSVLGMLTFALLLGGDPVRADFVHADPSASVSALPESCSIQAGGNFALCSTIAFASNRDNPTGAGLPGSSLRERGLNSGEIYLMNPDPDPTKQDPRRLTNNVNYDAFPDLSPDGKKIVFDSNRHRLGIVFPVADRCGVCLGFDNVDLFVMNADGSDQQHLTQGGSSTWDPRGKNVAYHASKSGTKGAFKTSLSAATVDSDIFVVNVDDCRNVIEVTGVDDCRKIPGEHWKNITNSVDVDDDPDWSPDGTKIVYTRHPVAENVDDNVFAPHAEIWVMRVNPDGTPVQDGTENPKQLTFTDGSSAARPPAEERVPTWSTDGTRIAFARRDVLGGSLNTWVMHADGTNQVQLRSNNLLDVPGSWSPDGTRILFNEGSGTPTLELFWMNPDGTDVQQLTNTPGTNATANWGLLRVHVQAPAVTQPARAPAAPPVPKR